MSKINRRRFLKSSLTGAIGTGIASKAAIGKSVQEPHADELKIQDYRTLGRTGFKVSDISYGAGNLTNGSVLEAAIKMGINYIDTAEHYVNGKSESTIGEVLKKVDRKSIFLTTKLNLVFKKSSKEDIKLRFDKCLERLQVDYVDCLMMHMASTVEQVKHKDFHEVVANLKSEGKIRFLGISNHGLEHRLAGNIKEPMEKVILAAAEDGRFDVALFVYNFLQKKQGEQIIKTCKEKNMGVTLMKVDPVSFHASSQKYLERAKKRGREIPESRKNLLKEYDSFVANAESFRNKYGLKSAEQVRDTSIKFVLSHPDVHCVCPTINTFEELETFVALSGKKFKTADRSMLHDYKTKLGHVYCRHACGICESACPNKIPVNTIMRYNHYFQSQGREKHAMSKYAKLTRAAVDRCEDCTGFCVTACPFDVPIQGLLMMAHQNLSLC